MDDNSTVRGIMKRSVMMQFAEKESFHHVVLNNLRNSPWTALITCANFSLEVYNQNHKEVF